MAETPEHLATRLSEEGEKTRQFFQALSPADLGREIYLDGACWTAREILAHFVSTESAILVLLRDILAGGPGAPESFQLDEFNEEQVSSREELTPADLLEQLGQLRQEMIDLVRRLTEVDLQRMGRHPFLGMAKIEDIIKLVYRHNQLHQRDIRRFLDQPAS